jgi:CRISPR-associated protein Cas10/Cmr2 subtype III-B
MNTWKHKLAAYLHDSPSKCLDIRTHGERADAAFRQAGFVDEEIGDYFAHADHAAAAADRLPFPQSRKAGLSCAFDGIRNAFRHPLSGTPLPFHKEFASVDQGFDGETSVQPSLTAESLAALPDDEARWQARFFAHWRLWPKHAAEKDWRLSLLPADTRIPDHTIWTHMQVASALDGCVGQGKRWKPAFLKFHMGPVQDFIAAARSIRDLWSGSYLLSWLMAAGMKALSKEVGPDAVIFPNLRGQPLFDLHWRDDLWSRVSISGQNNVWESLNWKTRDLLTPNLPNVFLALIPADRAAELGELVSHAIQSEWERIAASVWTASKDAQLTADEAGISEAARKSRFDSQIKQFLTLSWQATPWPDTLEEALSLAGNFVSEMPVAQARKGVEAVIKMATQQMDFEHRDGRYYTDGSKTELNNVGLGWSLILALNGWQLDAVRQTRPFGAANGGGWQVGTFNNKDSLTGREEAVAGGDVWGERTEKAAGYWPALFKKGDWLGATSLVKRVWHRAYLEKEWNLDADSRGFPMPNTRDIAAHQPDNDCANDEALEDAPSSEKYFAVLAFDGDEIGQWISGAKTPPFADQLANYEDGSGNSGFGAKSYFEKSEFGDFLKRRRPLSPSYHLQFSEALSNFSLLCARPIIEAYKGRLIYAGGDDVLALTPADKAIACAQALRCAFTGRAVNGPDNESLFSSPAPGYLTSDSMRDEHGSGRAIPILTPGSRAEASVGIAIAHFKAPLQDVVREAQSAEKRAKNELNRGAAAVTLMKRSGEIHHWGAKWDEGGLDLHAAMLAALGNDVVSAKFPHRILQLIEPYLTDSPDEFGGVTLAGGFTADAAQDILLREIETVANRQRGSNPNAKRVSENLVENFRTYLEAIRDPAEKVRSLIGLCQSVAFAHRTAHQD